MIRAFESFESGFDLLHRVIHEKVWSDIRNSISTEWIIYKGFYAAFYVQGLSPVSCEVVVVDDASTDNSTSMIEDFLDPLGSHAGEITISDV